MSKVKERLMEELENVARLTGEHESEVKSQWRAANRNGIGFNDFITGKARYKPKRRKK